MAVNDESILDSVKKFLMIGPQDTSFDEDVIMSINTAFSTLHQLAVGPSPAFFITDKTPTWNDFFVPGMENLMQVKSYVCLRAKQLFDLSATSYTIEAREKMIQQMEWRMNVEAERTPRENDSPLLNL